MSFRSIYVVVPGLILPNDNRAIRHFSVWLISAFLHQPKLLVLDEPFVGLDPRAAFTLKTTMKEFCEQGNAIFFSTHVLEVAEKICNKIAIIKDGELIACGATDDVRGKQSLEDVFMELTDHE